MRSHFVFWLLSKRSILTRIIQRKGETTQAILMFQQLTFPGKYLFLVILNYKNSHVLIRLGMRLGIRVLNFNPTHPPSTPKHRPIRASFWLLPLSGTYSRRQSLLLSICSSFYSTADKAHICCSRSPCSRSFFTSTRQKTHQQDVVHQENQLHCEVLFLWICPSQLQQYVLLWPQRQPAKLQCAQLLWRCQPGHGRWNGRW